MNLTCYIIDDEFHSIEVLSNYIQKTAGLELKGTATNPLMALNEIARADSPTITFLDVDMPELSGIEFAGLVNLYTTIVFTTSFPEYALAAFEKEAVDYLLKPISFDRFLKCVQRIKRNRHEPKMLKAPTRAFFFVHTALKGKISKVMISDIVYIEGALNYVIIHCKDGKIMPYLTMAEVEAYLPKAQFTRIHKSFIVNQHLIKSVEQGMVILQDNTLIPLGKSYRLPFLEMMEELTLSSRRKSG